MAPVVDGEGGFLPDTPNNLRLSKNYNMVPEIVTHTAEDAMLYALACKDILYTIEIIIYLCLTNLMLWIVGIW